MKPPLFVRPLTDQEHKTLQQNLHSSDSFLLRRSQILLASDQRQPPSAISRTVGRSPQMVRNVIHRFHQEGLACLQRKSSRPKRLKTTFDDAAIEALRELLHQSPRTFGQPTSLWTLELAAQVSFEQGLSPYQVSTETIRNALKRLGKSWQRAKHWIVSPDPGYARKKGPETG
jgi:transposase